MSLGRHIWIFAGRWIRTSSARCNGASSGRWKGLSLDVKYRALWGRPQDVAWGHAQDVIFGSP